MLRSSPHLLCIVAALAACKGERDAKPTAAPPPASATDLVPLRPALEAAPAPPAATAAPTQTIGFDWGPPCRVPALQDVEQEGKRARFGFDVVLERSEGRLIAKLDKLRVIPLPGNQASVPALDQAIGLVSGSIPPIAVAATGESEGALDIDKAIDATLALIGKVVKDPTTESTIGNLIRSPQWKAAFAQKAGETWDVWVGTWANMKLAPNSVERATYDLPSAIGTFKDVPITFTHHGALRENLTLVLLSVEQIIQGPELAKALGGLVQDLAKQVGSGGAPDFNHVKKVDRSTVAMDPRLGRPHRARHEMSIEVEDRKRTTMRDTAFDWSRAVGCTAAAASSAPAGGNGSAQP
jgi:hypothetical protein